MKKILLGLFAALVPFIHTYGQCDPTITVTPVLCSDPANNIYIVDPTADVQITIEDVNGVAQNVVWVPDDYLYSTPNQGFQYPGSPFFSSTIYFNGNDYQETGDTDGNGNFNELTPGPEPHQTLTYQAEYTITGCPQATTPIQIVLGGFTYNDICFGDIKPLSDIDILGIPDTDLTWYSDAAGAMPIPNTTTMVPETTYYVNLGSGFGGCIIFFPVTVKYKTPLPSGDATPQFCSTATWVSLGINETGATLEDLPIYGDECGMLNWYSDAAGTTPISNPAGVAVVDNTTYYVSQTVNGCESGLLQIIPNKSTCACIKNPDFEAGCNADDYGNHIIRKILPFLQILLRYIRPVM